MRKRYKIILVLLILFISIGFAFLTANLDITGTIAFKENTWDVHLDNIVVESDSLDADTPIINNSKDSVNFTVSFTRPGDYYEFYVDVINAGTMDATLQTISKTNLIGDYATYLNYNVTYYSGKIITEGDLLRTGYKERIKVRVEYKYDLDTYQQLNNINLSFILNYIKTDTHASTYDSKVWNFDFKGKEDTFIVPKTGTYKLEVWGAQGGLSTYSRGGYGGYSVGLIQLNSQSRLYINVGGAGTDSSNVFESEDLPGGYNGGGNSLSTVNDIRTGGGGATHIATVSGLLSNLGSHKGTLQNNTYYISTNILIVSSGGGGAGYHVNGSIRNGGSGGGITGNSGEGLDNNSTYSLGKGLGATQTQGGKSSTYFSDGTFGLGCSYNSNNASGGGGGFFGGGCGYSTASSGGGGSGYIANSSLTNKEMYCYNCQESSEVATKTISTSNVSTTPTSNYAKIGNGYAKITFIE